MVVPCTTQFSPPGSGLVQSVLSLAVEKQKPSEVGKRVAVGDLEALHNVAIARRPLVNPCRRLCNVQ